MTAERRSQDLRRTGDRITDEAAMRAWLASMTTARVRVERLSVTDPSLQLPGRR